MERTPLLRAAPRRTLVLGAVVAAAIVAAAAIGDLTRAPLAALLGDTALPPEDPPGTATYESVQTMKDVSGLDYVAEGSFIAAHDMKANEDPTWPRVSLLQIPYQQSTGLMWAPMYDVNWPTDRRIQHKCKGMQTYPGPNDLESVAGIPGTNFALLCESTNDREDCPVAERIYLAEVVLNGNGGGVTILDHTEWSTFTYSFNVEATAVAATDAGYIFLWAERDQQVIQWAKLGMTTTTIPPKMSIGGNQGNASFTLPESMSWSNRPVVGMDVDEVTGEIYIVTSYDLAGEVYMVDDESKVNKDNGAYMSATSIIGRVGKDGSVMIYSEPRSITYQDGFKTESVARAQYLPIGDNAYPHDFATSFPATFIGTDDENYGGTMRKLKMPQLVPEKTPPEEL